MTKSLRMSIETQTEENEIISICYLNEKLLALEASPVASVLFKNNRKLFDNINKSTILVGGNIYRQEVIRELPRKNKLMVDISDSYKFNEIEIANLYFENNSLVTIERAVNQRGVQFDFDRSKLSYEENNNIFNPNNPTEIDVKNSTIISKVRGINMFEDIGVRTFVVSDKLEKQDSLFQVGYRAVLKVDTFFKQHIIDVLNLIHESSIFLLSYYSNAVEHYDFNTSSFKDEFANSILEPLGGLNIQLNSPRVKNTDFGKVGISFYNGLLLLSDNVETSFYSDVLRTILPTNKTSPEQILELSRQIQNLYDNIAKEYDVSLDKRTISDSKSRVSSNKKSNSKIETITDEKISIEKEPLGYNIFSETQKGLVFKTIEEYSTRYQKEKTRYYPNLNLDGNTFLKSNEIPQFLDNETDSAFLTPSNLIVGNTKITTSRGMKNIPTKDIAQFRLAKASRYKEQNSNVFPSRSSASKVNNRNLIGYNLMITPAHKTILDRATEEEIDPLVDSSLFLGDNSYFVTDEPYQALSFSRAKLSKEEEEITSIVSDIIPKRFLSKKRSIKSISEIQFENPDSRVRTMIAENKLMFKDIPPQIKFMMTRGFSKYSENSGMSNDPLKNREVSPIMEETQKNIFIIKGITGFEKDEAGFLDVYRPIIERIDRRKLNGEKNILAKAYHHELPELGIVKDKFMPTIYNNLLMIRRK